MGDVTEDRLAALPPHVRSALKGYAENPNVTFIELKPEPPEERTYGYSDSQIRNLTEEQIQAQIRQSQALEANLKQQLQDTQGRTAGLKSVLRRKHILTHEGTDPWPSSTILIS